MAEWFTSCLFVWVISSGATLTQTPGSIDEAVNAGEIDGSVRAIAVQPDGEVLIAGDFTQIGGTSRKGLARLHPDGTLDSGFNPATEISAGGKNHLTDIAVQADGSVLVGGLFDLKYPGSLSSNLVYVLRLASDGSIDWNYGPVAISQVPTPLAAMALQNDEKLVVAFRDKGSGALGSLEDSVVARLDTGGRPDLSFGQVNGWSIPGYAGIINQLCAETGGSLLTLSDGLRLRRLSSVGQPLSIQSPVQGTESGLGPIPPTIDHVACEADGGIVISGWYNLVGAPVARNEGCSLARLLPDGTWDRRLALKPRPITGFVVQPDKRVVACVSGVLNRVNSVGEFDPFWQTNMFSGGSLALIQQPDGKTLMGGDFTAGGHSRLVRLYGDDQAPRAPIILRAPQSVIIMSTNEILLSVWASGHPLAYQWRRDELDMPGETNDAIRVAAKPGYYTVVISNSLGAVTSPAARVGVLDLATALNTPDWTWTCTNSAAIPAPWVVTTNMTHDGMAAALGRMTMWGGVPLAAELQTTITGPGTLSFWQAGGPVTFYVGGSLQGSYDSLNADGSIGPWQSETFRIPAGVQQLRWVTHNFPWIASCYMDEVQFVPDATSFKLSVSKRADSGSLKLRLEGKAGISYEIQASTNLIQWQNWQEVASTNGVVELEDRVVTSQSAMYYRAKAR